MEMKFKSRSHHISSSFGIKEVLWAGGGVHQPNVVCAKNGVKINFQLFISSGLSTKMHLLNSEFLTKCNTSLITKKKKSLIFIPLPLCLSVATLK